MKKTNKKGFTIVELVIVIAVIAILAAVLIPTFSGVVSKANQSAALQTAKSTLTNALTMSSTAQLQGKDTNGYHTEIVVDGYAFGYTGNQLKQVDYPTETTKLKSGAVIGSNGVVTNNFNAIAIAADNFNTATLTIADDIKTVITGSSDLTDEDLKKIICDSNGNYYINNKTALYINSDFSKKVVVYTTFSFTIPYTVTVSIGEGAYNKVKTLDTTASHNDYFSSVYVGTGVGAKTGANQEKLALFEFSANAKSLEVFEPGNSTVVYNYTKSTASKFFYFSMWYVQDNSTGSYDTAESAYAAGNATSLTSQLKGTYTYKVTFDDKSVVTGSFVY